MSENTGGSPQIVRQKTIVNVPRVLQAPRNSTSSTNHDEYLRAMKRALHRHSVMVDLPTEILSPRARHRQREPQRHHALDVKEPHSSAQDASRIGIIASMVPDEIIYKHHDYSVRSYETALMFIDVTGFTKLCEAYTSSRGGPSKLTQVLNSYIGAMILEIMAHNGDVVRFAGDAFLCMWKKTAKLSMQDVVHNAIDCGLLIQKNYGTFVTDIGVTLKVKVAISAGLSHFSIIGGENQTQSSYVIVGQPVWDVKMAQYMTTAGDVLTAASAWMYVNEAEYCTQPCNDGRHTKVLGVGVSWKRVEKLEGSSGADYDSMRAEKMFADQSSEQCTLQYKKYSLRPAIIAALRSPYWQGLRRFMAVPVLRAVDNDEPMDFLTEVRHVVVVFLNIITKTVTSNVLIDIVNTAYKCVLSVTSESGGYVNKVSMFDKDMMFLVVFGLRGLKHEDEAQNAVLCAYHLIENLVQPNIISVSVGVTSGSTYCGVVGHILRREYTVIGPAVNKAARLMVTYTNMVSCDKETFLRSKLNQEYFKLLKSKPLKGIAKPGPLYQFSKVGWQEDGPLWRHPILGRDEEMRQFKMILNNAIDQQTRSFTRYRDHKYAVVYSGCKSVGTSRLLEESFSSLPTNLRKEKLVLTEAAYLEFYGSNAKKICSLINSSFEITYKNPEQILNAIKMCTIKQALLYFKQMPFTVIRSIMSKRFKSMNTQTVSDNTEKMIRYSVNLMPSTPMQMHAMNVIFNCRLPLPEKFQFTGDILSDPSVKQIIQDLCVKNFYTLWVFAIDNGQFIDYESWRIILYMLQTKLIFFIIAISNVDALPPSITKFLTNHMIVDIRIGGIDRFFHAALACQLLDVQAIPADLEKVIESASAGLPGWIQNFVISLVQRGELSIVTLPRNTVQKTKAVMPSRGMLQRPIDINQIGDCHMRGSSFTNVSCASASIMSKVEENADSPGQEHIQMAVLPETYIFDNLNVDMTMDAIILKTYDSLSPFEKMLIKCGAVLGDVFSRRMLLHLLQSNSLRKVAEAVARLFSIRVLECEGGDFTIDTSLVLVHPAPSLPNSKPPFCACLGTRQPPSCRDLPMYAFCGYMKFRHPVFRTITYELLTESQKHEMHGRALLYLERYTRRCSSCGAGCFAKLLGLRCNSGLVEESEDMKRTRRQMSAISAEAKTAGEEEEVAFSEFSLPGDCTYQIPETENTLMGQNLGIDEEDGRMTQKRYPEFKRVRSFSSLDLENCECRSILQSVYSQLIDHCQGAAEYEKLFEAYLEYADLCININVNIPQGVRLLSEVESYINSGKFDFGDTSRSNWVRRFHLASVFTLRGVCLLEMGDLVEAKIQLFHAMELYNLPFPTSKLRRKLCNFGNTLKQLLALYVVPNLFIARDSGVIGHFYEDIAKTLCILYELFTECKEYDNASLAAKWALNYALRTNSNLRLLCLSYSNMISVYRKQQKITLCMKLEKRVVESCRRKRGQLDVTEVEAVCHLYTNIFLFYVNCGKKIESLEFGLSVLHMLPNVRTSDMLQLLILWMLKLLLHDLKLNDMVAIMTEFLYMTDSYELCSETWYYYYAINILLDTGYCVESMNSCEKFFIRKGYALLKMKSPEAAWNFFVVMWLVTVRIGAWERTIIWEEKITHLLENKLEKNNDFSNMMLIHLIEGLVITLVKEMDNRNIKKIIKLEKTLKAMFQDMGNVCKLIPQYRPRYNLMVAYYHYVKGKKYQAFKHLNKAEEACRKHPHNTIIIWVEHTRNHWRGTLNPKFLDYWSDHVEPDNLLDYREFDSVKGKIIPFTLPLPRDSENSTKVEES